MEDLPCGCPGSSVRTIEKAQTDTAPAEGRTPSELRQWPVQLTLVPPTAPWFQGANLLVAADCGPFAYADYHRDFMKDKVVVNACPKLDDAGPYIGKLAEIFQRNDIRSITVAIMEVPCCMGLNMLVQEAVTASGKDIPVELAVLGVDGERKG
jgi:hypothetical protein